MPTDSHPAPERDKTLTPEECTAIRALRDETMREDADLFLLQQIERDLAEQGVLGPDEYVEVTEDASGAYTLALAKQRRPNGS